MRNFFKRSDNWMSERWSNSSRVLVFFYLSVPLYLTLWLTVLQLVMKFPPSTAVSSCSQQIQTPGGQQPGGRRGGGAVVHPENLFWNCICVAITLFSYRLLFIAWFGMRWAGTVSSGTLSPASRAILRPLKTTLPLFCFVSSFKLYVNSYNTI